MRWQEGRRSDNIEDRRGMTPRNVAIGGGLGSLILIILGLLTGVNPMSLLQQQQAVNNPDGSVVETSPEEEARAELVKVVLADTEDVWNELLPRELGIHYEEPTLVLYTGRTSTEGCGPGMAAVGPFYCPGDRKVYLDLSFFDEMSSKFKAPGDFAQAYVVAHEVGHHVQNLLGITAKVDGLRRRISERDYNQLSVRLELQADYLAGVWAHHTQQHRQFLEEGDIEEAINAAHAIGDDTLQRQTQGRVVPDAFTHGTSEQRMTAFAAGLKNGDLSQLNLFFEADSL